MVFMKGFNPVSTTKDAKSTAGTVPLANEKEELKMSKVKEVKYRIENDIEAASKGLIIFDLRLPRYYLLREVPSNPKAFIDIILCPKYRLCTPTI